MRERRKREALRGERERLLNLSGRSIVGLRVRVIPPPCFLASERAGLVMKLSVQAVVVCSGKEKDYIV